MIRMNTGHKMFDKNGNGGDNGEIEDIGGCD